MSITFTMTARDMVTQAMRELRVIGSGDDPSSEEMKDGIFRLNEMLKSYGTKVSLWRDVEASVNWPANTQSMTLTPSPSSVAEVRLQLDVDNQRPVQRWESDDYASLPNKNTGGTPSIYTLRTSVDGVRMFLWPVPTTDSTIVYTYDRVIDDVVGETDPVDVPQTYLETIRFNLAVKMVTLFGATKIDPATVQLVGARAAQLEADMLDDDRPASYQMGTDLDGYP